VPPKKCPTLRVRINFHQHIIPAAHHRITRPKRRGDLPASQPGLSAGETSASRPPQLSRVLLRRSAVFAPLASLPGNRKKSTLSCVSCKTSGRIPIEKHPHFATGTQCSLGRVRVHIAVKCFVSMALCIGVRHIIELPGNK